MFMRVRAFDIRQPFLELQTRMRLPFTSFRKLVLILSLNYIPTLVVYG